MTFTRLLLRNLFFHWRGNLAVALGVAVGSAGGKITLYLQAADNAPRETLVGKRKTEDVLSKLEVTVRAVLPDHGLGRFTLRPGPEPPANAFVPLRLLQEMADPDAGKKPL